jgi:prepilin-type processing-associated H-X9-DG protein
MELAQGDNKGSLQLNAALGSWPGPSNDRRNCGRLTAWIVGATLLLLFLASFSHPSLSRNRETANQVQCANNLRQIGAAIGVYAERHNGNYPDSFDALQRDSDLKAAVFICPSEPDAPVIGTLQCSYVYVGQGLNTAGITSDTVIAYEPLSNHHGVGLNILYGDGHVDFMNAAFGELLIAKVKHGRIPVTMPAEP